MWGTGWGWDCFFWPSMMDNITVSLRAAAELSRYLCGLLLFVCYIQCYMFSVAFWGLPVSIRMRYAKLCFRLCWWGIKIRLLRKSRLETWRKQNNIPQHEARMWIVSCSVERDLGIPRNHRLTPDAEQGPLTPVSDSGAGVCLLGVALVEPQLNIEWM